MHFSGVFFNELIAPIPFFWKVPVLVIGAAVILLLVVMACGYRDEHMVYTTRLLRNVDITKMFSIISQSTGFPV